MRLNSTTYVLPRNEGKRSDDAVRVEQRDTLLIAVLADGLGSSREGGAAARRAVQSTVDYYLTRPQAWSPRRALAEFVRQINRNFYQESHLKYGSPELLCTLSAVVLEGGHWYGVNVGDSPVYLWRDGKRVTLSQAHTLTEQGLAGGLSRAVGMEETVEPFAFETEASAGDLLVLCSDGVSDLLDEQEWSQLLTRRPSARHLVARARELCAEHPERRDDAAAIVIDVLERDWGNQRARELQVLTDLAANLELDDYRLLEALDPLQRVWLAEQTRGAHVGARFVLKFPPLEAADDEARRDGFLREIWQATRIDSDDFVRAFVPPDGSLRYYAMDYVAAPTLAQVLKSAPLRVEEVIELGRFLLRACQFLLKRDHAHGDIKPDNILVMPSQDATPRFRLFDLGSSAQVFSVTSRAGTPTFLAPERFSGAPLSERTELFAIGVTLYYSLTRAFPYGEIERFQTPRFDAARPPSKLNPAVPPWLETVVLRAIATDAGQRYQAYSEMAFELSHPEKVTPFFRKGAPLLETNPLRFYKVLSLLLFLSNVYLVVRYVLQ
jgi:serine/threonine protein phosphatase PrpC